MVPKSNSATSYRVSNQADSRFRRNRFPEMDTPLAVWVIAAKKQLVKRRQEIIFGIYCIYFNILLLLVLKKEVLLDFRFLFYI